MVKLQCYGRKLLCGPSLCNCRVVRLSVYAVPYHWRGQQLHTLAFPPHTEPLSMPRGFVVAISRTLGKQWTISVWTSVCERPCLSLLTCQSPRVLQFTVSFCCPMIIRAIIVSIKALYQCFDLLTQLLPAWWTSGRASCPSPLRDIIKPIWT